MKEKVFEFIDSQLDNMTETLSSLVAIPAISPQDGGVGEYDKVQRLLEVLKEMGFGEPEIYNAPDPSAKNGVRPNVVVRIKGRTEKRLWFVAHIDVVPEGDRSLWETDPFKAVIKDGRIYGRGVNDNGQELISSLFAAYALKELGIEPEYEVCLCFVADEEVGSKYGIRYLIEKGLFSKDDLVCVPDMGSEDGSFIEIAEKSIAWFEFTAEGEQVHASLPNQGNNACRAANWFSVSLDEALHDAFPESDELFDPPFSTFEPTRRQKNVANVNTVPGREVFCFDCRVLPHVNLDEVEKIVDAEVKKAEERFGISMEYNLLQREQAPDPTPADSEAVKLLLACLPEVLPAEPKVGGVGGGTCAAYFRRAGIPAVVWGQESDTAHMPNEYTELTHLTNEAKVFALMMCGGCNK
jgi:succinyl-diaminopimelate desuccinylase